MLMALLVAAAVGLLIAHESLPNGIGYLLLAGISVVVFYAAPLLPGTPALVLLTVAAFFYYVNIDRVNGIYFVCAGIAAIAARELRWF